MEHEGWLQLIPASPAIAQATGIVYPRSEPIPLGCSMPTFAEEFDRSFRDARQRVFSKARQNGNGKAPDKSTAEALIAAEFTVDDFYAYMPQHSYIFAPTGELWPAPSVDARLPRQRLLNVNGKPRQILRDQSETIQASRWLDKNRAVEQMTWAPGEPKIIEGRLVAEGGWIERPGCKIFNLYRPPKIVPKPGPVDQWIALLHRLYGDDATHIERWLAHRVQRPGEKDLSSFNPHAPPPKTQAFWEIVDASRAPEDAELADAIDALGSPDALTLEQIAGVATQTFGEWLRDRKNARRIPHRLESCGYVAVRNDGAKDGHWKVDGRRQVVYAKTDLSQPERMTAAYGLIRR
jgi:hypothetical protein